MKMKAEKRSPSSGGGGVSNGSAVLQGPAPFIQALAAASSQYQAYETYLENGMICLKHKIRNIEKKKAKLDDYKERLKQEELNQDQLDAVDKYEEVIHNLEFAKDLQKTFVALNQELLKAQKKTLRREQLLRTEMEKRRLRTVLHIKYVLENFKQEHVQNDFRDGINGAFIISRKEISLLKDFCKLVCPERNERMALEDQIELVSNQMWELLEGADKIVVGSTYKHLKEAISRLLNCAYFDSIPVPHNGLLDDDAEDKIKEVKVTSKAVSGKDSESDRHFLCATEMQPREFLNRQYLNKNDYAVKPPEKPRNWEAEYVSRKQEDVPKKWDADYISRKQQEETPPPKKWDDEYIDKKQDKESPKKWGAEYVNRKLEEQPKKWDAQCVDVPETKRWESGSVPKESAEPKRILPEPKEKRDRALKQETEAKQVSKVVQQVTAEFCSTSSLPNDPELRRQKLQDLMSQIQGTCHFIQDSMLDSDTSSQSAIGSQKAAILLNAAVPKQQKQQNKTETIPSPPKTASELNVLSNIGASSGSDDQSSLSGSTSDLSGQTPQNSAARNSENEAYIPPPQLYQASTPISESLTQKSLETNQVTPLPNNQTASSTAITPASQGRVLQTPVSNSPVSMKTTPFQAMQTVFNVNAPLPPRSEQEVKSDAPYSPAFNQSLITASTQTPPQPVSLQNALTQDSLTEDTAPVANGTPVFLSHSQQNSALPRPNQAYFGSRGAVRGVSRGRGIANVYRGSSNGYKGVQIGFDGYRGIPIPGNGTYGPFPNREYPGIPYTQRESGYQQNYKRGVGVGPRGTMRGGLNYSTAGWSDSSQMSSPEQDSEHYNSVDSGQGDSRSMTPVDMPVTSQAATILPVHVYPLPQQMRVAFSTARTSNFTPGSLDQPIIFDLLLNNLGETFDFQLGRFTCPVNGTYVFIFHMLKLAVNVPLYVNLMKNDEVLCSAYANDGAPDHETASNHAVLQLFQGEQIWLRLHRGAIYGSSWKYSTFSGYLLYQD
ncbi:caprin-2 isoform X2 [Scyliorhinus canicula]|uniref:caprin-2 isoform X2 n=1 Tax=Scyliorhinus canicula TaxID=7830 RepID=UPI0018F78364|nr:caprin-2 isoform X2 [Scyliorhinus canicula]